MKIYLLLLTGLLSSIFVTAQIFPLDHPNAKFDTFDQFIGPDASIAGIENVLDSIVTSRFEFGGEYVFDKWGWEYDDLARATEFFVYRWDFNNEVLFQSTQRDLTYFSDKTLIESYSTYEALTPLTPNYRRTDLLDGNGDIIESNYEDWNADQMIWVPTTKYITTVQSDTLEVSNKYSWQEALQDYELSGKIEYRNYDLFRSTSRYNVDSTGAFVPNFILEYTFDPDNDHLLLFEQISYYPETDEWKVITKNKTVFDFTNYSGYTTRASDWHPLSNGDFIVYDSTTFNLNADYRKIEGEGFVPVSNNLDYFIHVYNYEWDYYPNNYLKEERKDMMDGFGFEPFEKKKYYRSEIEVTAVLPTPELADGLELRFPNPCVSEDQITINRLPDGIPSATMWVIDQSGRLLHQRDQVRVGEKFSMSDLRIGSGVHYVTLIVEGGQRTWQVIGG